jgi:hypothetical protein
MVTIVGLDKMAVLLVFDLVFPVQRERRVAIASDQPVPGASLRAVNVFIRLARARRPNQESKRLTARQIDERLWYFRRRLLMSLLKVP